MILSICPNPSIDCTIELDSLNVGMLNRISNKVETYSGKALNVAIGVARLNQSVMATGFMFEDHKLLFKSALRKEGVKTDFVVCEGSARVNYKIIDKKSMLTEINDKGERVSLERQDALLEKVKTLSAGAEIAVISGTLPQGVSADYYGKLVETLPSHVRIIIDAEKANVLSALNKREIFMIKPNLVELENFSEMKIYSKKDMVEASKKYIELGAKYVLISLGADGAVLTDGVNNYFCKSANVAVNSTVGAGDSMVSAVCVGLTKGVDDKELLKMAVAAGTAAVTTSGTKLFYKDKYDEIFAKISVEKF